jgi:hypothetical protein
MCDITVLRSSLKKEKKKKKKKKKWIRTKK